MKRSRPGEVPEYLREAARKLLAKVEPHLPRRVVIVVEYPPARKAR